jgi:hypothetical protein
MVVRVSDIASKTSMRGRVTPAKEAAAGRHKTINQRLDVAF